MTDELMPHAPTDDEWADAANRFSSSSETIMREAAKVASESLGYRWRIVTYNMALAGGPTFHVARAFIGEPDEDEIEHRYELCEWSVSDAGAIEFVSNNCGCGLEKDSSITGEEYIARLYGLYLLQDKLDEESKC